MDKVCACGAKFYTFNSLQGKCPKCQYAIATAKAKDSKKPWSAWRYKKKAIAELPGIKTSKPLKKSEHALAKGRAWKYFSRYIRLLYSKDGVCKCFTCGAFHGVKNIDAGHYISRSNSVVLYDEDNVRPQCSGCNRFRQGEAFKFRTNLVATIGGDRVKGLELRAQGRGDDSLRCHLEKEQEYKKKLVELENIKGKYWQYEGGNYRR